MVVLFDTPVHAEDFVHKCGRTGRGFSEGIAVFLIQTVKTGNYLHGVEIIDVEEMKMV